MKWYEGMIVGFDLETTGVDPFNDVPIQIGIQVSVAPHGVHIPVKSMSYEVLVDPGTKILNSEIHGITDDMIAAEGLPLDEAISELMWFMLAMTFARVPIVIYNAAYDWTILRVQAEKLNLGWDLEKAVIIDPVVIDRHLDKYRRGSRKQVDVARHYGAEATGTLHTASVDADLSVQIVRAMAKKYTALATGNFMERQQGWALMQQRDLQRYFDRTKPGETVNVGWPILLDERSDDDDDRT